MVSLILALVFNVGEAKQMAIAVIIEGTIELVFLILIGG